jgi:hypothetical protein
MVCQPGEAYFLSARDARQNIEPFMPLVRPSDQSEWLLAATATSDEQPLAVAVRGKRLYGIALHAQPLPHLAATGSGELTDFASAPPAIADKLVCVADHAGNLQTFLLPEMMAGPVLNLGSPVSWGPRAAGPVIVAATEDGHLHCVDGREQRLLWKAKLAHLPIVGTCMRDQQLIVAARDGMLVYYSLETGAEAAVQDIGEPLGEGLLIAGTALIANSTDGSLLKVPAP